VDNFLQEMKHHFTSSDRTKKTYRNKKGVKLVIKAHHDQEEGCH
jgi:hypothetical protein